MSTNLQVFSFDEKEVRTVMINNEPFWVAKDVCAILEHTNNRKAVDDLCDPDDVTSGYIGVVTGIKADGSDATQNVRATLINESGLYALIFGSRLEGAKKFKKWITSEVLPQIRKTGSYSVSQPQSDDEFLAVAILKAKNIIENKDKEIQKLSIELQEKDNVIETHEQIFKDLTDTKDLMGFRMLSKTLQIPEKNLRALLIENKIVYYLEGDMVAHSHGKERGFCLMKKELDRLGKDRDCVKFTKKGQEQILKLWSNQKQNTRVIFMKDYAVYK